ncbi:MAG: DUF2330 domain-containing protein [Myxococcota bacterium]
MSPRKPLDPRHPQLAILACLLTFGSLYRGFLPTPWALPATFIGAWTATWLWTRRRDPSPYVSASISCFSTLLLFRSTEAWAYGAVAGVAISSKHLLKVEGRHFVNPTNGAILLGATLFGGWVASGQWGHDLVLVFVLAGGAALTLTRAGRLDTAGAFLGGMLCLLVLRSLAFGHPWATIAHQFSSGSLWLFALYMITDPKTTPKLRSYRILHGLLVATLAVSLRQFWFVRDGFLWALLACAPLVPLFDRLSSLSPQPASVGRKGASIPMKTMIRATALLAALGLSHDAKAFCGFFAGKADAQLFNEASQVVLAHDDGKTVITMVNDYQGPAEDFALVVPVPLVLKEELVRTVPIGPIDHLDAFTAPRLAEYHDSNPCGLPMMKKSLAVGSGRAADMAPEAAAPRRKDEAKVVVEASFAVGEYDIVILSSKESNALESWLRSHGYNIPKGARRALRPYVSSGMKFFVAKVALDRAPRGSTKLSPLQFAFPDPRFMLPIRLGMLNAAGPQDLVAYVITRQHRAEVANYRNVRLPSNVEVPSFVKADFGEMYRATFGASYQAHPRAVFTEHTWNMGWCDPCASQPLSRDELEKLGVWWLDRGRGQQAFVTRLHARYTADTFPEDLVLKVTGDSSNFQVRYVLRHPYLGADQCSAAEPYRVQVLDRRREEVQTLARLTGWSREGIEARMTPLPAHFVQSPSGGGFLDNVRSWFR